MAKVKVTWKTMQDSFFIPARTSETPMPRPRKAPGGDSVTAVPALKETLVPAR